MRKLKHIVAMWLVGMSVLAMTAAPLLQDNRTNRRQQKTAAKDSITAQPVLANEDSIPDSLLHPRWKIQRTQPIVMDDLKPGMVDLRMPSNLSQDVVYNDTLDT